MDPGSRNNITRPASARVDQTSFSFPRMTDNRYARIMIIARWDDTRHPARTVYPITGKQVKKALHFRISMARIKRYDRESVHLKIKNVAHATSPM